MSVSPMMSLKSSSVSMIGASWLAVFFLVLFPLVVALAATLVGACIMLAADRVTAML